MAARRRAEKNELVKAVTEVTRRMIDFSDSVQKLVDIKDGLEDVDDALAQQTAINRAKMERLGKDLEDNKIRAVQAAARELNKTLITDEELAELKGDLVRLRDVGRAEAEREIATAKAEMAAQLKQALEIQKLQHAAESAKLRAEVDSHIQQTVQLNNALDRMAEELKSQKLLTASIVAPRYSKPEAGARD